jgi:hypothetical protein
MSIKRTLARLSAEAREVGGIKCVHFIYFAPSKRKYGCTVDIDGRLKPQGLELGVDGTRVVWAHWCTAEEASAKEREFNLAAGYGGQQLNPYTRNWSTTMTLEQHAEAARKGGGITGPINGPINFRNQLREVKVRAGRKGARNQPREVRVRNGRITGPINIRKISREDNIRGGRKGGLIVGPITGPINFRNQPREVKVRNGRINGPINIRKVLAMRRKCPHCPLVTNPGTLAGHIKAKHSNLS